MSTIITNTTTLTIEIWKSRDPSATTTLSFKLAEVDQSLRREYIQLGNVIKGINDMDNLIFNPHVWTPQEGPGIEPMSLQLHNYNMTWQKGAWNHDTFIGLVEWGVARIKRCYDIETLKITSFVTSPTFLAQLNEQPYAIKRSRSRCVYVITGMVEASGTKVSVCDCRFKGYGIIIRSRPFSLFAGQGILHSMSRSLGGPGPIPVGYSLHRLTLEKDKLIAEPVMASSFPKKLLSFDIDFPLSVSD
ncbi:hypothetical protein BDV33DRAFT_208427 [Aspergillus novoparasiticus]|uniref:Uncharacterized protein n=1 Tax=Aspergillus novoparasiticus TaxID=986946 RepID=A0A5N6EEU5_9EURO|nr:hypothetical protein BDV33DRAFT_208427 [Aspergillus novoparasiticus]